MSDELDPLLPRSAQVAIATRVDAKAMQTLMGMVTGIVADEHLHDREVALLSTWLAEHQAAASQWPGCAIATQLRHVLADGVITDAERGHLLQVLTELANNDFAVSGSVESQPLRLPLDPDPQVTWGGAGVVHTGAFLYGTRAQCEKLTTALGGLPLDNVTRDADVLVIGTRVSPSWVTESYGRKIMKAVELRGKGHALCIVPESYWFAAAQAAGH